MKQSGTLFDKNDKYFFFLDFSKIISAVEIAKCTPMFSHFLELFSKSINYFINVEGPTEPVVRPILYKKTIILIYVLGII